MVYHCGSIHLVACSGLPMQLLAHTPHSPNLRINPLLYHLIHLSNPTLILIAGCGSKNVFLQIYLQVPLFLLVFPSTILITPDCSKKVLFNDPTEFPCTVQRVTLCISPLLLTTVAQLCYTGTSRVLLGTEKQSLREEPYHFVVNNFHEP